MLSQNHNMILQPAQSCYEVAHYDIISYIQTRNNYMVAMKLIAYNWDINPVHTA